MIGAGNTVFLFSGLTFFARLTSHVSRQTYVMVIALRCQTVGVFGGAVDKSQETRDEKRAKTGDDKTLELMIPDDETDKLFGKKREKEGK